jgi:hypothetical protein
VAELLASGGGPCSEEATPSLARTKSFSGMAVRAGRFALLGDRIANGSIPRAEDHLGIPPRHKRMTLVQASGWGHSAHES